MELGQIVIIDTASKDLPCFIDKDNTPDKAYITCEVKVDGNEIWKGIITRISTSGKYVVRLTELIK